MDMDQFVAPWDLQITKPPSPDKVHLNNGLLMPHIHFGVYYVEPSTHDAIIHALKTGYVAFDANARYSNHVVIGKAI